MFIIIIIICVGAVCLLLCCCLLCFVLLFDFSLFCQHVPRVKQEENENLLLNAE